MGGNVTIENTTFTENRSQACPGISAVLGQVKIFDSSFFSQEGFPTAFVYLGTGSFGQVFNSTFRNSSGNAFFALTSEIHIVNSSFEGLPNTNGGLIYGLKQCSVFLTQISAKNIGGAVELVDCDCYIQDSRFEDFSEYGVQGNVLGEASISRSNFRNGQGTMGGAVYLIAMKVSIINSTFFNITGELGGAVYIWGEILTIYGSLFYNNIANSGGGVFLEGLNSRAVVSNSIFQNNSAKYGGAIMAQNFDSFYLTGLEFRHNSATWLGGALLLLNNFQTSISESTIENNTSLEGGGIIWEVSGGGVVSPPDLVNVTFSGNSAVYGPDIASFAEKLTNVMLSNCSYEPSSNCSFNASSNTIFDIPPGQLLPIVLKVQVQDHQSQTYLPDSSSFAVLAPVNSLAAVVIGISKVVAVNGTYTFNSFGIDTLPGSAAEIYLEISNGIIPKMKITFETRDCVPGEHREAMACTICISGTYGFNPSIPCKVCPPTATCPGGASLVPNTGYWRSGVSSDLIFSCPNPTACEEPPENPQVDYLGKCADGYQGNECQSCQTGYYHSSLNVCDQCPDMAYSVLSACGCGLLVLVLTVVIVIWVLRTASTRSAKELIFCKIFLNFVQLTTPVFNYTANWEEAIRFPYTAESTSGVATGQLLSIDCLIADPGNLQDYFFTKMLIVSLIPFVLAISATIVWSLIAIKNKAIFSKGLVGTFIVVYFMILAVVMKELFSAVSCEEVLPGEYWLTADLNIKCMTPDVAKLVIPSIIIWGVMVPFCCFGYLFIYRNQLREESFKVKFGFLTSDYRNDKYYWELVVFIRKCSIAFFSGFNMISPLTQAITIQLILLVFLALQHKFQPYYYHKTNTMEWYSLLVVNLSVFCCLYSLTSDFSQEFAWVLFIIGSLSNVCFLLYWIKAMKRVFSAALVWMKKFTTAICRRAKNCLRKSDIVENPRSQTDRQIPEIVDSNSFPREPNSPVVDFPKLKDFSCSPPDNSIESPSETFAKP